MESQIVSFNEFNESHLIFNTPVEKPIPNTPNQKYKEIQIEYNYGTAEKPYRGPLFIEFPEVVSSTGIVTSDLNGKKKRSLQVLLPQNSEECQKVVEVMSQIHKACANALHANKGFLGIPHFNKDLPEASNFKNPVYFPRDKLSGELIQGKNPNMYLTLTEKGNNKSIFCDLKENIVPWAILENVQMKHIPLVHVDKIYIGGNTRSLQYKHISSVLTHVVSKGKVIKQKSTIDQLKQRNPELANAIDDQIKSLKDGFTEEVASEGDETVESTEEIVLTSETPAEVVVPVSTISAPSSVVKNSSKPSLPRRTAPPSSSKNINDFLNN